METKKCTRCKEIKTIDKFRKRRQSIDGYDWWCKECWQKEKLNKGIIKNIRTLSDEISDIDKACIDMINNCRKRARGQNRNKTMDFDLNLKYVRQIVNDFCKNNYYSLGTKNPFKPSIDRIDSNKGYTKDNIKVVWLIENYCKNIFNEADVIEFCKRKLGLYHN